VPIGLVSKLTQGSTQNLSCGMFIVILSIRVLLIIYFRYVLRQVRVF
jgi:hypothetical protein